ncbi:MULTISPECIES: hypothetical protein [Nonomuraea]|uniref:Uncharacterized protein n=2 Tax=Nonomuraea TaxID=83681 RepID=A0ABX1AWR1_9ACTN|nr:hypothetical protein [Nonomuraea sp. FMUSA5-5]NJP88760.1 hypothetical protein [Nonomuraea sp. FMUSA5-5]
MIPDRIVRCSDGHLYTAQWAPFFSLRAVRLGSRRFARCPVDGRWRLVTTVEPRDLTEAEIEEAKRHHAGLQ